MERARRWSAILVGVGLLGGASARVASAAATEVVTVAISPSTEPGGGSRAPSTSADGRYVAFQSSAPNLVAGDTNAYEDVFVHDRQTGVTTRVSVDSAGVEGNSRSYEPSISGDGRYVAFYSDASNLVAGDTNFTADVFVHDQQTGATTRISVASTGVQGNGASSSPSISDDGRYVTFSSDASNLVAGDTNSTDDIFVRDRQTGATTRVSVASGGAEGNNSSNEPSISGDGLHVAFSSDASNLVAGDTNFARDVFVRDRQAGVTMRVSVSSAGVEGNGQSRYLSISGDGRYVAFTSFASNLVAGDANSTDDIFVRDRQTGVTTRVSVDSAAGEGNSVSYLPSISSDGRYVAFASYASNLVAGDTNSTFDIFVRDGQTGTTTRVSVDSAGAEGNNTSNVPSISGDGHFVAFASSASNLAAGDTNGGDDVFVRDRQLATTERTPDVGQPPPAGVVLLADAPSDLGKSSLSSTGSYVAFSSAASNLVAGDTNSTDDIFVRDMQAGTTTRVSVASGGAEGNDSSYEPSISSDGRYVAFSSDASNLVAGDTNLYRDIFVRDRQTGVTTRVSVASGGAEGNNSSYEPSISGDGRYVAFSSDAANLVAADTNLYRDVFVRDRQTGVTTRVSVSSAGVEGNGQSRYLSISGDGRYVAFTSFASNLVAADSNSTDDIFVRDRQTGVTTRVSVDSAGWEGNFVSYLPSISSDGRYVAFASYASNLVAGDTNSTFDIFVRDGQTGTTTRVSVDSAGAEGNNTSNVSSISGDGRFVAFASSASNLAAGDTNGGYDVFVHDRQAGVTTRVSVDSAGLEGNSGSNESAISGDGRFIGFRSSATNFVPGGDYNGIVDLFVRDATAIFSDGFESHDTSAWSQTSP